MIYLIFRLATALGLLALIAGCVHQSIQLKDTTRDQLPDQVNLTSVPFYPQTRFHCGPASLAQVINFHSPQRVSFEELIPKVWTPEVKGTWPLEMKAVLRRYNLIPYSHAITPDRLLTETAAGYPVLVMMDLGVGPIHKWHFAVLVGYDLLDDTILLRSATTKEHWMRWKHFQNAWRKAGYWNVVALPDGQVPASADGSNVWVDISDAQRVSGLYYLKSWLKSSEAWPDVWQIRLGAGNALYASGDFSGAAEQFFRGLDSHPKVPDLWNNLAYSLSAMGCDPQPAIGCAVSLQPQNSQWKDSLEELSNKGGSSFANCPIIPSCPSYGDAQ